MTTHRSLRVLLLVGSALVCLGASAPTNAQASTDASPSKRVVAYVIGWTTKPDFQPDKLTHINFAFARIDASGSVVLPHPGVASQLADLRALKTTNPRLKILISVGGWT